MPKTVRIWGPPGTGKTTYLMNEVDNELASGTPADKIGYYAFTRAAAGEAINRALVKFPTMDRYDLPHFRTIHSECYSLLGLSRDNVLSRKDLFEFAGMYGYFFSKPNESYYEERYEVSVQTKDDYLLFFDEWRRAKCMPDYIEAHKALTALDPYDTPILTNLIQFCERYGDYKRQVRKYDFTDMLTTVLYNRLCPNLKVLFVDESQDLNPLEFEVVKMWAEECDDLYLCGDPLQALYIFQGADPSLFFSIPSNKKLTITQSYRVPKVLHQLSMELARRTEVGKELNYLPTDKKGFLTFSDDFYSVPIDDDKRYFVVARNRCFLESIETELFRLGQPFANLRGMNPFATKLSDAIRTAHALSKGKKCAIKEISVMVRDFIPSKGFIKHGSKKEIADLADSSPDDILGLYDMLPYFEQRLVYAFEKGLYWGALKGDKDEINYFRRLISKYGVAVLNQQPNVILGTQHSVKGMECDIVICLSDMTGRTSRAYFVSPDVEIPCWYVAATRAKEGMFIIEPQGKNFFDW